MDSVLAWLTGGELDSCIGDLRVTWTGLAFIECTSHHVENVRAATFHLSLQGLCVPRMTSVCMRWSTGNATLCVKECIDCG